MTEQTVINNTDNFDVGTGKVNPQTHGTPSMNDGGDKEEPTPEIQPVEPLPAEEKPITFGLSDSEKDIDREKYVGLTSGIDNEAARRDNNKSPAANPDNEPAQEGGYNGRM